MTADRSISGAVTDYLDYKRATTKAKTLFDYERNLRDVFLPWCELEGVTKASQIDGGEGRVLKRFSVHLQTVGGKKGHLSPASVTTYTRSARWFANWLAGTSKDRGLTPAPKRKLLEVLTREEVDRLEDGATNERDRIIVRTLADTGLRLGELLALKGRDIYSRQGKSYVRVPQEGKTGEREVPIGTALARRLTKLGKGAELPIFMTNRADPKTGEREPLRQGGVEQMIHHLGREVLQRRVYPHLFRHSFATHAWKKGRDPIKVAKWLGHSSLTQLYKTYGHLIPDDTHADLLRIMGD